MDEMIVCQSCGMPLQTQADQGTNADGSKSDEYCFHCYANGAFTQELTVDEMVEINVSYLDEWNKSSGCHLSPAEARAQLREFLPHLKRWRR